MPFTTSPRLRVHSFAGLAIVMGLLCPPARAQEAAAPAPAASDPVLQSLLQEALARNPLLKQAEEELSGARQRPGQARALADPMLSLSYTNDGWKPTLGAEPMTTLGLVWSQDLPYPGKRSLRGDIAGREADRTAQRLERARLDVVAAVKASYAGLLEARARLDLVATDEELLRQIDGVVRARYSVGQGAQPDVIRVQIETTRLEQRRAERVADTTVRLAELNALVDRPAGTPLETPARLARGPVPSSLEGALADARERSPELADARLAIDAAQLGVSLAERDSKPDFSVAAGYMNRGGLPPMWQAGVGVTLPLYRSRIKSGVAEAEASRRAAEQRVAALGLQLRARTEERLARLRASERLVELYENGVIPQDLLAVEAALASYRVGAVPFVAVLEALTGLSADRTALASVLADHARLLARLESASLEADAGEAMPAPSAAAAGMGLARAGRMQ